MNKSKFLKRSLAALLAILMVVAMVPSAFAAPVVADDALTTRAANPGYAINVDGNQATWDSANDAYNVSTSFKEGNDLPTNFKASMIEVKNHTVTVLSGVNVQLVATVADLPLSKAEKDVDSFGVGTYTYTIEAVVTNDDGDVLSTNEYKLVVNLTMEPKSSDATLKAIKSARLPYAVSAKFDNDTNKIDIVMALGQKDTHASAVAGAAAGITDKDIFIPTVDSDSVTVAYASKKVTVTAENGDKKIYNVSFTEEPAFDTFKLGDFEGKASDSDSKVIFIDLPYSYNNGSSDITTTDINKMLTAWTTAAGNKVFIDDVAKESGKEALTFAKDGGATTDETENGKYLVAKPTETVKVQTKKSGAPVAVTICVRVPVKNPDAELTGIQIANDSTIASATNYTQYIAIDKGSRNITVNLPNGMKNTASDLKIHVWGAKNSYIELADGRVSGSNAFADDGSNNSGKGLQLTTDDWSANAIDVSKPITLKVISEDEATTLLYNLTVKESTSTVATLSSLKVVNDDGEEVGKVTNSGKEYTITLPYKYGEAANSSDLGDLKIVAAASSSAKIAYSEGEASDGAAEDVAAVYESAAWSLPAAPSQDSDGTTATSNISVSIGGHTFTKAYAITSTETSSGSGTYDHAWDSTVTVAAVLGDFVADYAANATGKDIWTASVNGNKVQFTAQTAGAIGGNGPTADDVTSLTEVTPGADAGDGASTWTPFVKEETIGDLADPGQSGITLPLASKDVTEGGDNDQAQNIFTLRVNNGSANGSNLYKVTIKKADASKEAAIKSVKVTDSSTWSTTMDEYGATVNTRTGRDTSTIKVNQLPYSLDAATKMYFSELETSDEAHVVIAKAGGDDSTMTEMIVTDDPAAVSGAFFVSSADNRWDKDGKEVQVWVYSEADWYKDDGVNDTLGNCTADNATKIYKMSASYAAAKTGSELVSIASTLDPTIKVDKAFKTVTITVPHTYVQDNKPAGADADYGKFSLNIKTSELATVNACESNGTSIITGVVSDEGDIEKKDTATKFTVVKSGDNYELKKGDTTGNAIKKLIVVSESQNNTTDYNVTVKVAPEETSYEITSITAAGQSAVKSADGETWTLTLPTGVDKAQLVNIVTASKLAKVTVDGVAYDPEAYYDLGDDLSIEVTAENGDKFTYTLKIEEGAKSSDATLSSVTVGDYTVTKSGNEYTVTVPEDTDVTALPVAITATDSKVQSITVNGEAYTAGMTVNLTEPATIVVTAEDGSTATYTLTVSFGTTPPDPDKKPSDNYTDIPAGEMGEAVKAAIDQGIMVGTSSTKFSPNLDVTRWQFALLIARADLRVKNSSITTAEQADAELMNQYSGTPKFDDTKNLNDLYNAAIEYCNKNGIVDGVGNNNFNPNGKVTRLMAARMISDWAGVTDETLTENTNNIKDWSRVNWGKHYVNSVYAAGFMQGYPNGNFGPADNLTRGQSAVVIMKAFEYKSGNN